MSHPRIGRTYLLLEDETKNEFVEAHPIELFPTAALFCAGHIPRELGTLSGLERLELYNNQLTGKRCMAYFTHLESTPLGF